MNIVKIIVKFVVFIVMMVGLGYFFLGLYSRLPSRTDIRLTERPTEVLAELSAMGDNTPVNSDLYAASTYRPDHPLYPSILAIQEHRWGDATDFLTPLAEQGNAEAMFWLGEITYSSNAFSRGGQWFEKAAKLGNPYAAVNWPLNIISQWIVSIGWDLIVMKNGVKKD
ncbi:hypothetical protein ACBZ90_00885 (plasmid) [Vibrio alginolyticus]